MPPKQSQKPADTDDERQYLSIKDIKPHTKFWTVKVNVLEKSFPTTPTSGNRPRFQSLLLSDKEGTRVQAVIFGLDIDFYCDSLQLMHQYKISNADVKVNDKRFRIVPHEFQWIINRRTIVEPVRNPTTIPIPKLLFTSFTDLHKHIDDESLVGTCTSFS